MTGKSGHRPAAVDLRRVLTGLRSKHEAAAEVIGGRWSWGTERTSRCTMMCHETRVRCPSGRVVRTKGETVQGVWHRPVG